MCWSAEASAVFAVAGIGITGFAAFRGQPKALWLTLGFFSGMEVLQAVSYGSIDQCGQSENLWVSRLSFAHLMFHPFFFNALALHFVSDDVRQRVQGWVYGACAVAAILMFLQLRPVTGGEVCAGHRAMCGLDFCTFSGNWHLAWQFPFNGWGNGFADHWNPIVRWFPNALVPYSIMVFIAPLVYGASKITAVQYLVGPVLAALLTDNIHEQPAVWCLLSFWIAFVVVFSPLRRWLRQDGWVIGRSVPV